MKLEKREITLNERDSLQDILLFEKALLNEYLSALTEMERKETREGVLDLMREVAKESFLVKELLKKSLDDGLYKK